MSFAEQLGVLVHVGAEGVMTHPGTDLPRPPRVVEAGAIRVEEGRPVQEVGQAVRQVLAGGEVADPDHELVLPPVTDGVEHEGAVGRKVPDAHARGAVGVDVEWVDHDLEVVVRVDRVVLALLGRWTPIDGGHLAVRLAEREVLVVAGPAGEQRPLHVHEFPQAGRQLLPQRRVAHDLLRVRVLRGDPGPRLGAVLVFQPPVVIGEGDAVQRVDHGFAHGLGRGRVRGAAGEGECEADGGEGRGRGESPSEPEGAVDRKDAGGGGCAVGSVRHGCSVPVRWLGVRAGSGATRQ